MEQLMTSVIPTLEIVGGTALRTHLYELYYPEALGVLRIIPCGGDI